VIRSVIIETHSLNQNIPLEGRYSFTILIYFALPYLRI